MSFDWIPGVAAGLITGALGFLRKQEVTDAVLQANLDALRQEFKLSRDGDTRIQQHVDAQMAELQRELREAISEFRAASLTMAKLSSSQEVINAVTGKALEGIVRRQEEYAIAINDSASSIRLLGELINRIQGGKE